MTVQKPVCVQADTITIFRQRQWRHSGCHKKYSGKIIGHDYDRHNADKNTPLPRGGHRNPFYQAGLQLFSSLHLTIPFLNPLRTESRVCVRAATVGSGENGGIMAVIKNIQEKYMKEALKQAKKAYALGEVPIGCVIVHQGKIIGRGYNRRNTDKNTLSHAEITAIRKASKAIGDWRLEECTLYVTLEPCQMCAGAIVQARIPETVIGCMNPKAGCAGSILNVLEMPEFNHQVAVTRGVLEQECSEMLKTFFAELRVRNKAEKEARKLL